MRTRWGRRKLLTCVGLVLTLSAGFGGAVPAAAVAPHERVRVVVIEEDGTVDVVLQTAPSEAAAIAEVAAAHPTAVVEVDNWRSVLEADPFWDEAWQLDDVNAPDAWSKGADGAGVTVAVVDTGVDASHLDLTGRVMNGADFVGAGNGTNDPHGHGTHVAGIVAATLNNGVGIAGVAPEAQVLPVRVLDAEGSGRDSDIAAGITWAADEGADVINLSLGGPDPAPLLLAAIQYARGEGAVVVCAAGNEYLDGNPTMYPAAYSATVAVGAVTQGHGRAGFSSTGSYVDIAAPGSQIYSTLPGDIYGSSSGTSMAAPVVAATAADVLSKNTDFTPGQIINALTSTAVDLGPTGRDNAFGYGLVDASAAVDADGGPPVTDGTTKLKINAPASVLYDRSAHVSARLRDSNGEPVTNQRISYWTRNGGTWVLLSNRRTDEAGYSYLRVVVKDVMRIRATYDGQDPYLDAVSSVVKMKPAPVLRLASVDTSGRRATVHVRITPADGLRATLQRRVDGRWKSLDSKRATKQTRFARPHASSRHRFRVVTNDTRSMASSAIAFSLRAK